MPPKFRDVLAQLRRDGWIEIGRTGSHFQLKHPTKPGHVTVAGKPGDDVPVGLLKSIFRQAGLKR
jgi:predicted RNA binding protein YcfA (HicA-like mRNA interferase family)